MTADIPTIHPSKGGIVLKVWSEPYGVICACVRGQKPLDSCQDCHGTGTRTVRLAGEALVQEWYETGEIHILNWEDSKAERNYMLAKNRAVAISKLVAAYRAGTLPESMKKYLVEIEVEE